MEENIKDKPEIQKEKAPGPTLKPGGQGFTVTPVSPSPSSQPTTPLPKAFTPPSPVGPPPEPIKSKKDVTTFFLLLVIIFIVLSLLVLVSIGLDKIPDFLTKFFLKL